ncbi:MAG: translation initiation factor IF-3 [bacterium]|nr:translation initiation factor IF-3 [bacterium]MDD3805502.1 translation initiation factor IF-3 [bacterium]MDD4153726.1 translation initiation factor IF-3 [bacterium]MDD4557395.1 translation initiation factor IF-3 [bacterium]
MNERIRVPEVRVIGSENEQLGIMPTREALARAREEGLDLVEVAANAAPPVARIMDYGKFKYEQSKKAKETRRKAKQIEVKEVKMRPKIDEHDYDFKTRNAKKFLQEGDKVKMTIMFRGREMAHTEFGIRILEKVAADVADSAVVERPPKIEGRNMTMILSPKPEGKER